MTQSLRAETLEAYEHWAPLYQPVAHNPLMRAEEAAMLREWPEVEGRRALDLACGTGRYARLLADSGAAHVAALDFSAGMLRRAACDARVRANMTQLPFAAQCFRRGGLGPRDRACQHTRGLDDGGLESARRGRHAAVLRLPSAGREGGPDALVQGSVRPHPHGSALWSQRCGAAMCGSRGWPQDFGAARSACRHRASRAVRRLRWLLPTMAWTAHRPCRERSQVSAMQSRRARRNHFRECGHGSWRAHEPARGR